MELKVGAPFEFVWRNDQLNDPPSRRPEGFPHVYRMGSRITDVDPPRRLTFTWEDSGDVTFDLAPQGDEVLLTVTHRRLPDRDTLLEVSAGWHAHLDILIAHATGETPPPYWDRWSSLRAEYDRRLPA